MSRDINIPKVVATCPRCHSTTTRTTGVWYCATCSRVVPDAYEDEVSIEYLPNGLWLLRSRMSGLQALYNHDGTYRHGDLRVSGLKLTPTITTKV